MYAVRLQLDTTAVVDAIVSRWESGGGMQLTWRVDGRALTATTTNSRPASMTPSRNFILIDMRDLASTVRCFVLFLISVHTHNNSKPSADVTSSLHAILAFNSHWTWFCRFKEHSRPKIVIYLIFLNCCLIMNDLFNTCESIQHEIMHNKLA